MVPFQNPTIYIGSLRIDEPITVLTDFIFVTMCLFSAFNVKSEGNKLVSNYRLFFLITGISTFVAALLGHAFLYHFGLEAKIYGWVGGIIGSSFAQIGSTYHVQNQLSQARFKQLIVINMIEIIGAFISVFIFWSFVVVEIHMAFGLLVMATSLEIFNYNHTKSQTSKFIVIGVGMAVLAVLCHILKVVVSIWFNHMDLSHLLMTASIYFMYKGIKISATKKHNDLL